MPCHGKEKRMENHNRYRKEEAGCSAKEIKGGTKGSRKKCNPPVVINSTMQRPTLSPMRALLSDSQ